MISCHSIRSNYHRLCKKVMNSFVQIAYTSHACARTRKASCVAKKCRKRRRLDFPLLQKTNTYAECVRVWMTQKSPWATAVAHDLYIHNKIRTLCGGVSCPLSVKSRWVAPTNADHSLGIRPMTWICSNLSNPGVVKRELATLHGYALILVTLEW